jgi:hypothetical protein
MDGKDKGKRQLWKGKRPLPAKDYTASALKALRRVANALALVRGVVPDKKLAAQLEPNAEALALIHDTVERIAGNKTFDGPCAFHEVIEKQMRRDKKFRAAIYLTGFFMTNEQFERLGDGKENRPDQKGEGTLHQEPAGHA